MNGWTPRDILKNGPISISGQTGLFNLSDFITMSAGGCTNGWRLDFKVSGFNSPTEGSIRFEANDVNLDGNRADLQILEVSANGVYTFSKNSLHSGSLFPIGPRFQFNIEGLAADDEITVESALLYYER